MKIYAVLCIASSFFFFFLVAWPEVSVRVSVDNVDMLMEPEIIVMWSIWGHTYSPMNSAIKFTSNSIKLSLNLETLFRKEMYIKSRMSDFPVEPCAS